MRENKKSSISSHLPALTSSVSGQPKHDPNSSNAASLWLSVVSQLEESVCHNLSSDDILLTMKSIRSLRHFAVASTMNKSVISNSSVLRPRLIELLERVQEWSTSIDWSKLCIDLCGLVNSLVRDCNSLADDILSRMGLLQQLLFVIRQPRTLDQVRETCLLLLRSLFLADDLSSVLFCSSCQSPTQSKRRQAALDLFSKDVLRQLLDLLGQCQMPCEPDQSEVKMAVSRACCLTYNAYCWLVELLSVLSTEPRLAHRLHHLGAMSVCHKIVDVRPSIQRKCTDNTKLSPIRQAVLSSLHPTNQLATKFALKMMVHLLFYVEGALASFRKASLASDTIRLLSCYSHLVGAAVPTVCYSSPHSTKRSTGNSALTASKTVDRVFQGQSETKGMKRTTKTGFSAITCLSPTGHTTQALVGLLRGLVYWNLWANLDVDRDSLDEQLSSLQSQEYISADQRLGVTDSDVALLIIQPLTEAYLNVENTRLMAWICHVLVMILNDRPDFQLWAVYTNSFIREVNLRLTSLMKAVHEASNGHNHTQLVEHLIPIVRLFTCLASGPEATRVLIGELSMCEKLIDFILRLKSLGPNRIHLLNEFQHAVAAFLHILSRSFRLHHTLFLHEDIGSYLLKLVDDSLISTASGHQLWIDLVHSASAAIANLILPMSRLREILSSDAAVSILIRLATISTNAGQASPQETRQPDLTCQLNLLRINGIWCLGNLLHTASPEVCTSLFHQLVATGAWLEILKAATLAGQVVSHSQIPAAAAATDSLCRDQMDGGTTVSGELEQAGGWETGAASSHMQVIEVEEKDEDYVDRRLTHTLADITVPIASGFLIPAKHKRSTNLSDAHLLIYQTLRLLRNLLRSEEVIDMVVEKHWWNITQLIVLVLEGGQPQTIKEMAILLVAHLAIGRQAGTNLQHNEDLVEKLKVFMRSPNSYTKSAALTATYNLLGLGREDDSGNDERSDIKDMEQTFQSLDVTAQHQERADDETRDTLPIASITVGEVRHSPSLIATPTAIVEAEEEVERITSSDPVYEQMSVIVVEPAPPTALLSTVEACTSQATPVTLTESGRQESSVSSSPEGWRSWHYHALSSPLFRMVGTATPPREESRQTEQQSVGSTVMTSESLSGNSPSLRTPVSSSTSLASCAEDEAVSGTTRRALSDLGQSRTHDTGVSSPSCSDDVARTLADAGDHTATSCSVLTLLGDCSSIVAPLATQERLDDSEPVSERCCGDQTPALVSCSACAEATTDSPTGVNELNTNSFGDASTSDNATLTNYSRHSSKEWEMGFRQILLPFLQELNADTVLRSTWDWLMLRAERHNQPVRLHHMLEAWQLLYNQLPSFDPTSSRRLIAVGNSSNSPGIRTQSKDSTGLVTVQTFLHRLQQTGNSSDFSLSSILRQTAVSCSPSTEYRPHHHRRRHRRHNCHRHQLRSGGSQPSTIREASSTSRSTPDDPNPSTDQADETVSQTSPGSD